MRAIPTQNASMTFIEMISVSGTRNRTRANAIESSNYSRKDQMVASRCDGKYNTANYIREANSTAPRYILFLMHAECKTPVQLMRIDSAGSSVTFITLDGKTRTCTQVSLHLCDRNTCSSLI